MVKVTTSINIDNEKRELAKRKGLVLSDILDHALDIALGIELKESTILMNDKEDLLQNKEVLEIEKDKFLKDHEDKLQALETEKNLFLKEYENKINEIDFKIKQLDDALENAIIEDKEETKEKEYIELYRFVIKNGGEIDREPEVILTINKYADKYEMSEEEYEALKERLEDDIFNYYNPHVKNPYT